MYRRSLNHGKHYPILNWLRGDLLFATDIPKEHLRKLIEESYATFTQR